MSASPPSPSPARDLEARAQNEFFRAFFRLPRRERLHAVLDCSLWTPFSRCHTAGQMFTSDSYICFASKEAGCCKVVLPLREVDLLSSHGAGGGGVVVAGRQRGWMLTGQGSASEDGQV